MWHKLNITNDYVSMIHLDEFIGLKNYISLPEIEEKLSETYEIHLENIAINLYSEEIYYQDILKLNPNCFIKNHSDPAVLLKNAKLTINKVKCVQIIFNLDKDYFHSWPTQFNINDLSLFCRGASLDYMNTHTFVRVIFSGRVELFFNDEDMLLYSEGFNIHIDQSDVNKMNDIQAYKVSIKQKTLREANLNLKKSNLWEFEYLNKYFEFNEITYIFKAIKDYDGTDI